MAEKPLAGWKNRTSGYGRDPLARTAVRRGSLARALLGLALDELGEARRLLEGGQAGGGGALPGPHLHPPRGGEPRNAPDEAPEEEGSEGVPAPSPVHALILGQGARLLSAR